MPFWGTSLCICSTVLFSRSTLPALSQVPLVPGIKGAAVSLNVYTWNLLVAGSWVVSQSMVATVCLHLGDFSLSFTRMFRRRTIPTMVSSNMLAEESTRINIRLPPIFRSVRYWRSPWPGNGRSLDPCSSEALAPALKRLTSSSRDFRSAFNLLTWALAASVSLLLSESSTLFLFKISIIWRESPCIFTRSVSVFSRELRASIKCFFPSSTCFSIRLTSARKSDVTVSWWAALLALINTNSSITAPKPQVMMSRKARLNTFSFLRFTYWLLSQMRDWKLPHKLLSAKALFWKCLKCQKCLKLWYVLSARSIWHLIGKSTVLALIINFGPKNLVVYILSYFCCFP